MAKVREIWLAGWVRAMRRNQLCPDCREVRSDDGYGHFVMPRGFSGPFYSIVDRASKISPTCNVTICGTGLNALMMESSAALELLRIAKIRPSFEIDHQIVVVLVASNRGKRDRIV